MRSTKALLDRVRRSAPPAGFDLEDLQRRRDRRRTRQRIGTTVVALALTAAVFGTAFLALRERDMTIAGSTGSTGATGTVTALPPPTRLPLVAASGQYYYWAVRLVGGCSSGEEAFSCEGIDWRLDATYWWGEDDSGRVEVDEQYNYGIAEGRFGPGAFPNSNAIDVSDFPTDPIELTPFLLARSQPHGSSPAPLVTPPPDGAPEDGRMWRAITDLLADPHTTPTIRAALLEVAAGLRGSHLETDVVDPVGRPAHVIVFGNWGGDLVERLYVDPATHELLGWTKTAQSVGDLQEVFVVQSAGLASSTETAPDESESSIPWPLGDPPQVQAVARPTPTG